MRIIVQVLSCIINPRVSCPACIDDIGLRFLIDGSKGAVLHTGDVRAEPSMIYRLATMQPLAKYLCGPRFGKDNISFTYQALEVMYVDTASFFGASDVPEKVDPVVELKIKTNW
jgi:hypothetical protein